MSDRLTAYAQYLVDNKDRADSPEYRTVMQAYIAARSQTDLSTPAPASGGIFGMGGLAARGGDKLRYLGAKAAEAVRGPRGLPELGQFPMDAKTAIGTSLTNDPAGQADIVRKNYPGAQMMPIEADGKRYTAVANRDPETGKVASGYINPPGLDIGDVARFSGQAAAFVPAAKWGAGGKNFLTRAIKGFTGGAGTDVALQKGAQIAGSDQPTDLAQSAFIGAIGAALEPLAPMVKAGWRRIFREGDNFNPRTGTLTEAGRKAAKAAGLNPDEMDSRVAEEFGRLTREGPIPPEVAQRVAATTEFKLPATRGQLTQDYRQLNLEDRMRRGLEGDEPKGVLKDFDKAQEEAIALAQQQAQRALSGAREAAERPGEAGQRVLEGVRRRATDLDRQVGSAYENVRALDDTPGVGPFVINDAARKELPDRFKAALSERVVDDELTPASSKALRKIEEMFAKKSQLNIGTFETERRRLNEYVKTAKNDADRANVLRIKSTLDEWMDDVVDRGLFSGDEAILEQLKQARGLRAEYGRLFEGKDAAGKIVNAIVEKAQSPEEVVNYIFSASKLGGKQQSTAAVRKLADVVGKDSDEWGAIKEIAWMRLSRDKTGKPLSAQAFEKSWKEALNENKSLVDALFSQSEQGMIRRYNKALQATKRETTNASQSAFAFESALRYTLRRFGQRESFTKGNVGTGTLFQAIARAPINPLGASSILKERQAIKAISPFDTPRRRAPLVPAAGEAGARQREGY